MNEVAESGVFEIGRGEGGEQSGVKAVYDRSI
jgi:hypothetical protein